MATLAVPARGATDHMRGIILGTTLTSLDIGLPNQDDVHFDMSERPDVVIAEPASEGAIVPGVLVGVVIAKGRTLGAVVVPKDVRLFERGRVSWDRPAGSRFTFGLVARRAATRGGIAVTVAYGRGKRLDILVDAATQVATIRSGSRAALLSPQHCFVISHPESDGISDTIDRIVVGDGTLVVPL